MFIISSSIYWVRHTKTKQKCDIWLGLKIETLHSFRDCLDEVARIDLSLLVISVESTMNERSSFPPIWSKFNGNLWPIRYICGECRDTPLFTFWHCIYAILNSCAFYFSSLVFYLKAVSTHIWLEMQILFWNRFIWIVIAI